MTPPDFWLELKAREIWENRDETKKVRGPEGHRRELRRELQNILHALRHGLPPPKEKGSPLPDLTDADVEKLLNCSKLRDRRIFHRWFRQVIS